MGEFKGEKFREKAPELRLYFPSLEEFEGTELQKLHSIWRQNNLSFLALIREQKIPYFGLHGTPGSSLKKIQESKKGVINVATFFSKKEPIQFLSDLYVICGYVPAYAFRIPRAEKDPGGILILDLDKNDKNFTVPWEPLYGTAGGLIIPLVKGVYTFDRAEKYISKLKSTTPETMARNILKERIFVQDVLAKALTDIGVVKT